MDARRVVSIVATRRDGHRYHGSGYQVTPTTVLTAAHVLADATSVEVRFDAGGASARTVPGTVRFADDDADLAVLSVPAGADGGRQQVGRLADEPAILDVAIFGYPRWKVREPGASTPARFRVLAHEPGSVAVLANGRESTLQVTVAPPAADPAGVSPWEGMSGAPVFVGDRLIGVVTHHHPREGLNRLTAARIDRCLDALDTSAATAFAAALGLATPDDLADVVPPSRAATVASAYQAQVRDIAPRHGLVDRERERDELTAFCAGDEPYLWWQAGPWAGKTALLSTFVLDPPANVVVVSFFITARLASQTDSTAFTEALLEQLSAYLGQPLPALHVPASRDAHRRRLLLEAADHAARKGQRLVLVVDGIDEDTGADVRPALPSIASLLPKHPAAGLRVLLAGRPHPPIPHDVPADHPIRTCRVRRLDPSPWAGEIAREARLELSRLLSAGGLRRDIVGCITASGGGLTIDDLEHLTGGARDEIEDLLGGVFGRTVQGRTDPAAAAPQHVYLFAHETLRTEAIAKLGRIQLQRYLTRIHAWADEHRDRGWPDDTPTYLLRAYTRTLTADQDHRRLAALALDGRRRGWLQRTTNADAAALSEITTAQQLILRQPEPDLTATARLAYRRDELLDGTAHIPARLPALWATLGHAGRAEALAMSISRPDPKREALTGVIEVLVANGDDRHAERLLDALSDPDHRAVELWRVASAAADRGEHDRAERLARSVTEPQRSVLLARLATAAAAAAGDDDRADRLARAVTNAGERALVYVRLAEEAAAAGRHDRTRRLAGHAERALAGLRNEAQLTEALTSLAEAVAGCDPGGAAALIDRVERLAQAAGDPEVACRSLIRLLPVAAAGDRGHAERIAQTVGRRCGRSRLLPQLVEQAVAGGHRDLAERIVQAGAPPGRDAQAMADFMDAMMLRERFDVAERLADAMADPRQRCQALLGLSVAVAAADVVLPGQPVLDRVMDLAAAIRDRELMQQAADLSIGGPDAFDRSDAPATAGGHRQLTLIELAAACLAAGDDERAERLMVASGRYVRVQALIGAAAARTADGDPAGADRLAGRAQRLIVAADAAYPQALLLIELAEAVADGGDHDRVRRLVDAAERALQATGRRPLPLADLLARLAHLAVTTGDRGRAEQLAEQVWHVDLRGAVLARIVDLALADGDLDEAERVAATVDGMLEADVVTLVSEAALAAGDLDQVDRLISTIFSPYDQWTVQARLMHAAAGRGDFDTAERFLRPIEDSREREHALARLVGMVAAAGDDARAERLAAAIGSPARLAEVWAEAAEAAAAGGTYDRAEAMAGRIADPVRQAAVLTGVAVAAAAGGDQERARRLGERIERLARAAADPYERVHDLSRLVDAVAALGDHGRAGRLAGRAAELVPAVTRPDRQLEVLARLLRAVAGDGEQVGRLLDRSGRLVDAAVAAGCRAQALAGLAVAAAGHAAAVALTERAGQAARAATDPQDRAQATGLLAQAIAAGGDHSAAERAATAIADAHVRATAVIRLVAAAVADGEPGRARRLAGEAERCVEAIADPYRQADASLHLLKATGTDPHERLRAERLAEHVERLVPSISSMFPQVEVLTRLVAAVAARGDHARAARLADRVEELSRAFAGADRRAEALAGLAEVALAGGDHERARRLVGLVEQDVQDIHNPNLQGQAIARLVQAAATLGDHERAEDLARATTDLNHRARNLSLLAQVLQARDEPVRARQLLAQAWTIGRWSVPVGIAGPLGTAAVKRLADEVLTG
ncbi:trypsin-like peptidase domain-containing protein [Dactylosporangium sp. NPDC050688]|uniref:trypsin-like peptidase domain-containing protein n=1 Tax=Dactylosporangium sp. NPDC050688 TaxID=3157217 RepID=UPI0033FE1CE0